MEKGKQRLIIDAARLYYESDLSQQEIAKKLGVSRPTISRLLQQAKELGFVRIEIMDPMENNKELARKVKSKYGLHTVLVCNSPINDDNEIIQFIAKRAAELLNEIVTDGDIVGVTWGNTMYHIATNLKKKRVKGVEVIQLNGGISQSQVNTYASETVNLFAEAFNTIPRYLPLPIIFDNPEVKKMVESDRHIRRIIEMGKQANVAVFTVGTVKKNALLFRVGYFNKEEEKDIQQHAVGDICSRFFTESGEIFSEIIDKRTVGIELEELKKKEKSILIAGGEKKIEAIHGALSGKYANYLITDQFTAKHLLELE
ncbi:sugar-binding transcriptional regulator [Bacillus sp. RG28]|uniref:Sugar-binding transcriptional regulator n=1 Tax=Gottfriedia endophytica TaxID=2820819 RepID=A0A940NMV0_9BACI|nr:sugar-binding transcriptional regulator [Gottfriedia endophytica]MBP0725054.1 sugar-binding transcriptional regulator [Gottfriedia endophytica]